MDTSWQKASKMAAMLASKMAANGGAKVVGIID